MKTFTKIIILLTLCAAVVGQNVTIQGTGTVGGTDFIGTQNPGVSLVSIAISPANPLAVVGQMTTFNALGTYSDGSTQDVTSTAIWTVSSGTAATNVLNVYTCNSQGIVTVVSTVGAIIGTTTLTCNALQIVPSGTLTAQQGLLFVQLFTATGGIAPYTFSASGLPTWLTLSNASCPASFINCDLSGIPSTVGAYSFSLTVTDSSLHILTIPITVQVTRVSAEDNKYCNPNGVSTVNGQFDGPAALIQQCVYNAIANTPAVCIPPGCTVPILTVCTAGQLLPNGLPVPGCLAGLPPFYSTIQAAFNALTSCGQQIQIYDVNYRGGFPVQNTYDELLTVPGLSCGPNDPTGNGQWIWVVTTDYANLPNPGTRITPAWAGQVSLPGRPSYSGPSTPGIYVPLLNPSLATCETKFPNGCPFLTIGGNGVVPSGFRFMGLELAWTKNHQTAPGFFGAMVQSGCSTGDCNPGAQYIIFDRMIAHACQDKSDVTCTDAAPAAFQLQDGNYQAVINSFIYGFKTIGDNQGFLGPQDESHGISGGNIQGMCHDGPTSILNNYIETASQFIFFGGGTSDPASASCPTGSHPYDLEIRRNTLFRPTTWMVGPFNPENNFAGGSIFDAWVASGGNSYPPAGSICTVAAPPSGTPATCTNTVASGKVSDISIINPGNGYNKANPRIIVWRYPNTSTACGPNAGCTPPAPAPTITTTGGTFASGHNIFIGTVFVHSGDGYITDPFLSLASANPVYTKIQTAGCAGSGCQVIVPAPAIPAGFSGYSVYSCDAGTTTIAACTPNLQLTNNACVNITGSCTVNAAGTGSGSGNEPGSVVESNLFPEDGIYIVKNDVEMKHIINLLLEANVANHVWTGQSDENATCFLFGPRNDLQGPPGQQHQNCPNCEDENLVLRYNACRGASKGISMGLQQATQGGTLAAAAGNASFHDNIWELSGMWITAANQFGAGSGTTIELDNNGQPGTQALQNIKVNHNTKIHTEPASFSSQSTYGSMMSLLTALCGQVGKTNTTAVLNGFTNENNVDAGGFRNTSQKSAGCFQCQISSATCNSTITLSSKLTNAALNPVSSSLYTTNEITGLQLNNAGTCSVLPTGCSINNFGAGSGGTCGLITKNGSIIGLSLNSVGQGYTHASVVFSGGTCSVNPVGTVLIGGAGNPSPQGPWCADHNMNVTNGWPGEDAMLGSPPAEPSAQGDTVNSCFAPSGGGWIDIANWSNVGFTNFSYSTITGICDQTGPAPCNDDLHLTAGSSGHLASNGDNQGRDIANGGPTLNDMGADIDLVLLYTGCTIQNGVMVCP